jgi:hypothetical protein
LVQGALGRLGMAAFVTAETSGLPQCQLLVTLDICVRSSKLMR